MTSLFEKLADRGVKLKSYRAGHNEHVLCPQCGGGNHREHSLSVTVDEDGQGAVGICHRGSCGWQFNDRLRDTRPPRRGPLGGYPGGGYAKGEKPPLREELFPECADWVYDFFAQRHIGPKTVDTFMVASTRWRFGEIGEQDAMMFPYRHNGRLAGRKYRPRHQKSPQSQENSGAPVLFNGDSIKDAETVYWVEGEPDVMAMFECGYAATVSLRDGAPREAKFRPDDARFAALDTHAEELSSVKRFVLAGDNDLPGLALREELARRLGRHRCDIVTWPQGCKDACDVLSITADHDGTKPAGYHLLRQCVSDARPYPIEGVHLIERGMLEKMRHEPSAEVMTTGAWASDQVLHLPTEGRLIVVTGFPSHGKSSWTRFIAVHTANKHGRRWMVFSPEHQPWKNFVRECAEVHVGKPLKAPAMIDCMTREEGEEAEEFLLDHLLMMEVDAEDQAPTLDWIISRAEMAVLRYGITDLLIDPWNELEHMRGEISETDYIARCLQRFKAFGFRHGCNVWVVVHPAKPPRLRPGENYSPPLAYDISGSAHWYNKADVGLTIWSPKESLGTADIMIWKTRFRRWGQRSAEARLDFDSLTGIYRSPVSGMS